MTLLDALRILELAAPITPEGVDLAGQAAMQRLWEQVQRSPGDTDLAARAEAHAGVVRAAHAFLRQRPMNLYPYRVVGAEAEQGLPAGQGGGPVVGSANPFAVPGQVQAAAPVAMPAGGGPVLAGAAGPGGAASSFAVSGQGQAVAMGLPAAGVPGVQPAVSAVAVPQAVAVSAASVPLPAGKGSSVAQLAPGTAAFAELASGWGRGGAGVPGGGVTRTLTGLGPAVAVPGAGAVPAAAPGHGAATFTTPPPPPRHLAPVSRQGGMHPRAGGPWSRLPGWGRLAAVAAVVLVCGAVISYWVAGALGPALRGAGAGTAAHYPPGVPPPGVGFIAGTGEAPGAGTSPATVASSAPPPGGTPMASPVQVGSSYGRPGGGAGAAGGAPGQPAGSGSLSSSGGSPPAAAPTAGRISTTTEADGTVVTRFPNGDVSRVAPGGNSSGTYGPGGSPFGNGPSNKTPSPEVQAIHAAQAAAQARSSASYTPGPNPPAPPPGARVLTPSEHLAMMPPDFRKEYEEQMRQLQDYLAKAEKGDVMAQYHVAQCYSRGKGTRADFDAAEKWYTRAAQAGYGPAQLELAVQLSHGPARRFDHAAARHWYQKAAEQGSAEALRSCGQFLLEGGLDVPPDLETAMPFLQRAADLGDAEAQYLLGKSMIQPSSRHTDYPEGLSLLEKAAAQDHGMARFAVACTYLYGTGRPADPAEGVRQLERFVEKHPYPIALMRLADCYRDGLGTQRDYEKALALYTHWQSLRPAQFGMSLLYENGWGVEKDNVQSIQWLQTAAASGHAAAIYHLGMRYAKGLGLPQNDAQAAGWFTKAAGQGYAPAQAELGRCYQKGLGVTRQAGLAIHHLKQAAEQGFPQAQDWLGTCYAEGDCTLPDPVLASRWYSQAATQGYAPAQVHLGMLLLEDYPGLPADPARALAWFIRAESLGDKKAAECARRAREGLPPEVVATAQRTAPQLPQTPAWNQWHIF